MSPEPPVNGLSERLLQGTVCCRQVKISLNRGPVGAAAQWTIAASLFETG